MCSVLTNGASKLINGVYTVVSTPCQYANKAYNCLGKQITRLSNDKLPPSLAKLTQQIYYSLPYSVGLEVLHTQPLGIVLGSVFVYAAAHIVHKEPLSKESRVNLYAGVAHFAAYGAITTLVKGILCRNPLLACTAAIPAFTFLYMQAAANRVQASGTTPEPQKIGGDTSSALTTPLAVRQSA